MLKRLNKLEDKLESLLQRFADLRQELADRTEESRKLKTRLKSLDKARKAPSEDDALLEEHRQLLKHLQETEEENRSLKEKIGKLEKEIENKAALEEETLDKLRSIISRIDALEAEIGELEHEQTDSNHY